MVDERARQVMIDALVPDDYKTTAEPHPDDDQEAARKRCEQIVRRWAEENVEDILKALSDNGIGFTTTDVPASGVGG